MPAPVLLLAALGLGAAVVASSIAKKNPPRAGAAGGGVESGAPYLPSEAFAVITSAAPSPEARALQGALAFTDVYAEIGMTKLLRYKIVPGAVYQTLPGGGGAFLVTRANLAYRTKIADGGIPKQLDDTALGVFRKAITGGVGAAIATRALATVPNIPGLPASKLLFRTVMDDLRLFPDSIVVVTGDPAVLRTLATMEPTATNRALGIGNSPVFGENLAVITTNLALVTDLPLTTDELINKMAES